MLGVVRLLLARQRGNLPAAAEEARRLQTLTETPHAAQPGLGEDLRALALINLGITEFWTDRIEEADQPGRSHCVHDARQRADLAGAAGRG